jgi:GNAT superfamily N-acetyltransferase
MNTRFEIRKISATETWSLRHQVLRPHQTLQDCQNPQDEWPSSFHLGAFDRHLLVGIASFHEEAFPSLSAKLPFRLRGMATDPLYHRQGVGRLVLEQSFMELRNRNCDLLWCNAREAAFSFYKRLGLLTVEPLFDISGIGPHKVMYKYLS